MPISKTQIAHLLLKRALEQLTTSEHSMLESWKKANSVTDLQLEELTGLYSLKHKRKEYAEAKRRAEHLTVSLEKRKPVVHRFLFLRVAWLKYAAAIIILFGTGVYLYITQKKPVPQEKIVEVPDVPAPTSNYATITLADGRKIRLDEVKNGVLAKEGPIDIRKTNSGEIIYSSREGGRNTQYNTLSVPRGSEVASVVLSDGSKVFLNAASSLKYPVSFNELERKVEITGEAYFEIAKDAKRKFVVMGKGLVTEVLGTHFNVNAYPDELSTKVTLIEGKVKVSANNNKILLQPGQQAEVGQAGPLELRRDVNINQVIAWQKGMFVFRQMDLGSMMRQVSRWYNIDVHFQEPIQSKSFSGVLSRRSPLSEVIKILEANGVSCMLEGSTLTIGN